MFCSVHLSPLSRRSPSMFDLWNYYIRCKWFCFVTDYSYWSLISRISLDISQIKHVLSRKQTVQNAKKGKRYCTFNCGFENITYSRAFMTYVYIIKITMKKQRYNIDDVIQVRISGRLSSHYCLFVIYILYIMHLLQLSYTVRVTARHKSGKLNAN